jgi:4-aminobutyrate aminotransferase-like enzyme
VLATLDVFERRDILGHARRVSPVLEAGLVRLKEIPFVRHVRGEEGGVVWGVEIGEFGGRPAPEVADACVLAAYRGDAKGRAVHLMGPLAKKVLRIAPPLVITEEEARESADALYECFRALERELSG